MAEQLIKGASRRYVISNAWLDEYSGDASRFVDVMQIRNHPNQSQYLTDLVTLGITIDLAQEQQRASFWLNGFAYGNDDDGTRVRYILEEDDDAYIHRRSVIAGIEHPMRVRRVYPNLTEARDIEFLGVAKISPTGV